GILDGASLRSATAPVRQGGLGRGLLPFVHAHLVAVEPRDVPNAEPRMRREGSAGLTAVLGVDAREIELRVDQYPSQLRGRLARELDVRVAARKKHGAAQHLIEFGYDIPTRAHVQRKHRPS